MVRAIERGLSLKDFEILTIGMILDYIIEFDNLQPQDDEPNSTKEATQRDFDAF